MSLRIKPNAFLTGTLAGLVAVVLMAVAAPTTVWAQPAPLNAHFALRPLTRGDIAAYKLTSTTQVSPGFTTVALGEPAYMEAQINSAIAANDVAGVIWTLSSQPKGSVAALEDSPLTTDVPLFEPADRLTARAAGRKLLR